MQLKIHTNNGVITFKDKVLSILGQIIIAYLNSGGSISNYSYVICLYSGNTYLASYSGTLSYCAVGSNLKLIFTFVIPQAPSGTNTFKLVLYNTFFQGVIACATNVTVPFNTSLLICWILCFQFNRNDSLTPLLVFAMFGVPTQLQSRLSISNNVQNAFNAISNYGYIKSPVTIYVYICGKQYIPTVNVVPSGQTYLIEFNYIPSSSQSLIKSICLVICLCKGSFTFFKTNYPVSTLAGQILSIEYAVTIE